MDASRRAFVSNPGPEEERRGRDRREGQGGDGERRRKGRGGEGRREGGREGKGGKGTGREGQGRREERAGAGREGGQAGRRGKGREGEGREGRRRGAGGKGEERRGRGGIRSSPRRPLGGAGRSWVPMPILQRRAPRWPVRNQGGRKRQAPVPVAVIRGKQEDKEHQ